MSQFTKDQLIWAKIKGFPWWPAIIGKVYGGRDSSEQREFLVNFVGDYTHATLPESKIIDFDSGFGKFSNVKTKKLADSISMARNIFNGVSTFEEENMKITQKVKAIDKAKSTSTKPINSKMNSAKDSSHSSINRDLNAKSRRGRKSTKLLRNSRVESTKEISESSDDSDSNDTPRKNRGNPRRRDRGSTASSERDVSSNLRKNLPKTAEPIKAKVRNSIAKTASPFKASMSRGLSGRLCNRRGTELNLKKKTSNGQKSPDEDDKDNHMDIESEEKTLGDNLKKKQKQSEDVERVTCTKANSIIEEVKGEADAQQLQNVIIESDHKQKLEAIAAFQKRLSDVFKSVADVLKKEELLNDSSNELSVLADIMAEFQQSDFNGSYLVNSTVGKLFKSIHHLMTEHRSKLGMNGLNMLNRVARMIHNIKQQIVAHCLDTTEVLSSLDAMNGNQLSLKDQLNEVDVRARIDNNEDSITIEPPVTTITTRETRTRTRSNNIVEEKIKQISRLEEEYIAPKEVAEAKRASSRNSKDKILPPKSRSHSLQDPKSTSTMNSQYITSSNKQGNLSSNISQHIEGSSKSSGKYQSQPVLENSQTDNIKNHKGNQSSQNEKHKPGNVTEGITVSDRKKIGCKLARFVSTTYQIDREKTEEVTSQLETKILTFSKNSLRNYKLAVQGVFFLIRDKELTLDSLISFDYMDFDKIIQEKVNKRVINNCSSINKQEAPKPPLEKRSSYDISDMVSEIETEENCTTVMAENHDQMLQGAKTVQV